MTCPIETRRRATAAADEARRVGRNIRGARLAANLSQPQLGALVDKTFHRISDYEHGRHIPAPDVLRALETALDKPIGYFHVEHAEFDPDGNGTE